MSLFINCPWCGAPLSAANVACPTCGATLENGHLASPGDPALLNHSAPASQSAPEPAPASESEPTPAPERTAVAAESAATQAFTPVPESAAPQNAAASAVPSVEAYWRGKVHLRAGDLVIAKANLDAGKLSPATFDELRQKYLSTPIELKRFL